MNPPQHTSIRTPRDQQNVPVGKPQILVAEHATRHKRLRARVRGVPKEQDQYVTHQSPSVTYISHPRSYAVRSRRSGFHH